MRCGSVLGFGVRTEERLQLRRIRVAVRVLDPDGNLVVSGAPEPPENPTEAIADHFRKALRGNPYFSQFHEVNAGPPFAFLFIEFKAEIIQYWNDNIGDYYGNANSVAAEVFQAVCGETFFGESGVFYSTRARARGCVGAVL